MTLEELTAALNLNEPSEGLSTHEKALWYTHHDEWDKAHDLVQEEDDALAALIHGYLHYLEGDHWNGDYWYRRSGYEVPEERDQQWNYILGKASD